MKQDRCYNAYLPQSTAWYNRVGTQMNYWGGAAVNSGQCACGSTGEYFSSILHVFDIVDKLKGTQNDIVANDFQSGKIVLADLISI